MLHRFLSILAIVSFCFAHEAKAQDRVHVDSNYKKFRCGPGPVAGVIILEVYGVGFSYIASKPSWYGDKIMGGVYAASSIAVLGIGIGEYINNAGDRKEQICGSILYLGISYGLSRLAVYNLFQAEGQSSLSRSNRNFIEFNAAFIGPAVLYCLSELCFNKFSKKSKDKMSFYFTGNSLMFAMNL